MQRWIIGFFLVSLSLWGVRSWAQQPEDIVSITAEGAAKSASSVEAAKEIQSEVVSNTVRTRVLEIVGEKRFARNKTLIENKIVRQSAKIIPFINTGAPQQQPDGTWKMSVEMKLSLSSLRKMVLDAGLSGESDGPASILSMIVFTDRLRETSLRWWVGDSRDDRAKFLSVASRELHEIAQLEFSRQGFHLIRPLGQLQSPLPEAFRVEQPTSADYQVISDYFAAPMILKGDVRFKDMKDPGAGVLCAIKLQVVHANSGRTAAEVSRQIELAPGAPEAVLRTRFQSEIPDLAKDLATQVFEAWSRGTLNTNQVRLAVRGRLTPKQIVELRAGLAQGLSEIKSVRERLIESPTEIEFEVNYTGELASLTERLKALKVPSFDVRMAASNEPTRLTLDVRPSP